MPNEPRFSTAQEARGAVTAKGKAKLARVVAIQKIALQVHRQKRLLGPV
jgi:hypothetical protein